MNILITNDDGIFAPGIAYLAKAAAAFGNVTVVAPDSQCSAMSHRIILTHPMRLEPHDLGIAGVTAYSVDGTPADCVKAGLGAICREKPDVVLSGINNGYNVGFDIAYSGTVGAAMEALMQGVPAIALSKNDDADYSVLAQYLPQVLEELMQAPPSGNEIWNVNFPSGECRGILRDRLISHGGYYNGEMHLEEENGVRYAKYPAFQPEDFPLNPGTKDSDLDAVNRGYISISRVHCPVM